VTYCASLRLNCRQQSPSKHLLLHLLSWHISWHHNYITTSKKWILFRYSESVFLQLQLLKIVRKFVATWPSYEKRTEGPFCETLHIYLHCRYDPCVPDPSYCQHKHNRQEQKNLIRGEINLAIPYNSLVAFARWQHQFETACFDRVIQTPKFPLPWESNPLSWVA